ncbi:MAG: tetratricopeptide repeat protein, partial [Sulfuricaulis sp.]
SRAQYLLGRMYQRGHGVPQDLERGKHWLARAAAQGNSDAIKLLHFFADVGEDTMGVYESSREQLKKRAAEGDVEAQYQLALRYETGAWDVRKNPAKAIEWFNKAAASGYKPAMRSLADIYEKGLLGVKPDPKLTAQWRERAK